jgi:hypothetical protein
MAKLGPFFMQNPLFRSKSKFSSKKRLKCSPKKIIGLTCCKNWFYFSLQFCDVTSHHSHSHLLSTRRFSQIWLYMRYESKTIEASFCIVGCLLEPIIEIRLFIKKKHWHVEHLLLTNRFYRSKSDFSGQILAKLAKKNNHRL